MFNESNSIQIPTKELRKALVSMHKLIGANVIVPILEFVVIRDLNGTITISGSDLQTIVTTTLAYNPYEARDESFLIEFSQLRKLVALIRSDYIYMRKLPSSVSINCDEGYFELESDEMEDYPKKPFVNMIFQFAIETNQLKEGIALTSTSICTDDLRPAMTGVHFSSYDDYMVMAATDGHKLVSYKTSVRFAGIVLTSFILQRKLMSILAGLSGSEVVSFKIGSNNAEIYFGETHIVTRLIDERFPDYLQAIPEISQAVIKSKFVLSVLRRKIALAGIMSNRTTNQIKFSFRRDKIEIKSEDFDYMTKSIQSIDVIDNDLEEMEIGFNAKFLLALLKPVSGDVTFHVSAPNKACIITIDAKYSSDVTLLIMPVMLNTY